MLDGNGSRLICSNGKEALAAVCVWDVVGERRKFIAGYVCGKVEADDL